MQDNKIKTYFDNLISDIKTNPMSNDEANINDNAGSWIEVDKLD